MGCRGEGEEVMHRAVELGCVTWAVLCWGEVGHPEQSGAG